MRALIGCERSGVIRNALRAIGVDAWSCDLEPAEDGSAFHYAMDVFEALDNFGDGLDLFIVHPECTYLSSSGLHWNGRVPGREAKTAEALAFVERLLAYAMARPWLRFCLENPQGCIGTRLPLLDAHFVRQTIQPHDYGEDASKQTVLRLQNLPKLTPTHRVAGRWVTYNGKRVERWANQTDSGQNRLTPSENRWMDRARTYPGIATAKAQQWGKLEGIYQ